MCNHVIFTEFCVPQKNENHTVTELSSIKFDNSDSNQMKLKIVNVTLISALKDAISHWNNMYFQLTAAAYYFKLPWFGLV